VAHSCAGFAGIYITVVFWLPNRRFFLTMDTMDTIESVEAALFRHALLYGVELVFFAIYMTLIYRRLAISGISLLAFALSSQSTLFQAKCISSCLLIFGFPLRHNENDAILSL